MPTKLMYPPEAGTKDTYIDASLKGKKCYNQRDAVQDESSVVKRLVMLT
jgi:hypothetical protein